MKTTLLHLLAATGLAIGTTSCGLDGSPQGDTSVVAESRFALTGYVDARGFNHSGLRHSAGASGLHVDHTRDNAAITTYDANHGVLGDVTNDLGPGDDKTLRIQTLEQLTVGGQRIFRVWAGSTSHDGWVESKDVATIDARTGKVTVNSLSEEVSARAGNGESCEDHGVGLLNDSDNHPVRYIVTPKSVAAPPTAGWRWLIDASMRVTDPWTHFTPAWDHPARPSKTLTERVFLLWSWTPTNTNGHNDTNFAGGGVVRTEMAAGSVFYPCKVMPIRTVLREAPDASNEPPADAHRMTVFAAYGKFKTSTKDLYGWTIIASSVNLDGGCKMHVCCNGGPAKCPLLPSLLESCSSVFADTSCPASVDSQSPTGE